MAIFFLNLTLKKRSVDNTVNEFENIVNQFNYKYNILVDKYKTNESFLTRNINIPIYYINLDRSTNRKTHMEEQLKLYNLNAKRVSAIDGKKILTSRGNIKLNDNITIPYVNNYKLSNNELGCTLSHLKAIYNSYMNGDNISLIIEDDVSFVLMPFWFENLDSIIKSAPLDWKIINLYTYNNNKHSNIFLKCTLKQPCYGAVAYIINREGMKNVIYDILKYNKILLDGSIVKIDGGTSDILIYHRAKNSYVYNKFPLFITHNTNIQSTIHDDHTKGHIINALNSINKYSDYL